MKASGVNDSNAACESDTNVSTETELEFNLFYFPFSHKQTSKKFPLFAEINYTNSNRKCNVQEMADLEDIDLNEGISVPSAPEGVEVADFDATSAKIKWKAAPENEAAFVNGYLIEYKETREEDWSEFLDKIKPNKYPSAEVTGLNTGSKYEFRVS